MATAAAASGFLELIPTAVIFRTGCGETERKSRKCAEMYEAGLRQNTS